MTHTDAPAAFARDLQRMPLIYLAVGLVAGSVIALQIGIMRVFSVGSWAHFGSLVVSLAMLGFGLTSAVMCVAKGWFERHWEGVAAGALILFGPFMVASNLLAQQVPFNAIFLVSDPMQKWRLFANFMLYLLPFLCGAAFLGCVFLRAQRIFGRVYFADLVGSGLCGLLFLPAMYLLHPEDLITMPLVLWAAGSVLWFAALGSRKLIGSLVVVAILSLGAHLALPDLLGIPKLAVSDYKGVSYARKFPDSNRVYARASPFGYLEVYGSSYLHFAPGLSDNAAFNLKEMPSNAYLGLYIDGDGPSGVIRDLPPAQTEYFKYLPMIYPYLIKKQPDTFVVQFGGGLSTAVALKTDSKSVTVAEGNPEILRAFREDKALRDFTSDILNNKKLSVIDYDGRIYLGRTTKRYDVIDLSLADSAGLSNPGGFAIVEKFAYSREAMTSYMRALNKDGVLSVTLWNKEEPPKSVMKLYATMAQAAKSLDGDIGQKFFAASSYLSTATVLYKRDGFTPEEIQTLREHSRAMSFDTLYYPGMEYDGSQIDKVLEDYHKQIFAAEGGADAVPAEGPPAEEGGRVASDNPPADEGQALPATVLGRAAWHTLVNGGFDDLAARYVFDVRPLTNDRPYFAAYVKPLDLPKIIDRLDLFQDEWGYLLLWATLAIAAIAAFSLVLFPVIAGWRTIFSHYPGKFGAIIYFACLGAGYIMVEVGLIAHFILALSNATVSASILITGMLVFSGLGALVSEKIAPATRTMMPLILAAIGVLLIGYGFFLDRPLDWIGTFPYVARVFFCFVLIAPPAFLMGFPMPIGMTSLARLGKTHMFLWAWGINGCFSVLGAAIVPLVATAFGLSAVLMIAGGAYLLAIPALFALLVPLTGKWAAPVAQPQPA
jgi:spermidine synthase